MSTVATLAELKALGRIDYSTQDTILQTLLDAVEDFVEEYLGVRFTKTTVTERLDGGGGALFPTRLPIKTLVSVKDKWEDDLEPPVTLYTTETQVRVEEDGCFPAGTRRWEVTYEGGYDGDVPAGLKIAILQLTLRVYGNPDLRQSGGGPGGVVFQNLLSSDAPAFLDCYSFQRVLE